MIKTMAAISMMIEIFAPIDPMVSLASGRIGEIGSSRMPSIPSVPVTDACTRTYVRRQIPPQTNSALGTSA